MRNLLLLLLLLVSKQAFLQCTPANLQATSPLNTPGYALSTSFNTTTTSSGTITNLSNGIISFSGTVAGTATWVNGIRIENDPTADIGNYIYVQPTNTDNATTTNVATYTFTFSEALYNISFRVAGLNNQDQIRVSAFNGATPITLTAANFSNMDAGISVSGGNTLTGTSTAGGTDVNSNRATITLAGPVTSIVMTSGKSDNSNSTVTLGFTSFAYTRCVNAPADFNMTFVNTAISGNVSTNDVIPSGTQYGTAAAQPGNPGSAVPTVNANGTYSFTSSVAGTFRFTVPMCPPGVVTPNCPNVPLVINVSQPTAYTNNPIANIDRVTTQVNTAVTLNTLANDKPGNNSPTALNPASVSVTVAPLHGSTSINTSNGNITYTPSAGYTGYDTLTYRVCDATTPVALCATSLQIITIQAASTANNTAAADDFNTTSFNTAATGNVRTNDNDPQGHTQTVSAQTTTAPGKGTLVLNTAGAYTFTPLSGFSGPVNFPYQTCDNGTPQACTNATLYLVVYPTFVLPVKLVSFSGGVSGTDVNLHWSTESQVNFSHFEVERSATAASSFIRVGIVGANNAAGTYVFTDRNAGNLVTKAYYRLKMVDIDGRVEYSNAILISFDKDAETSVQPTLVKAGSPVYLSVRNLAGGSYAASLYNASGSRIRSWSGMVGANQQIETSGLPAGTYFIKLVTGDGAYTHKITVY